MRKQKEVLFRRHKRLLKDSMDTIQTVNSLEELKTIIAEQYSSGDIEITYYGYDERIDWDNYIVVLKDYGVIGFVDKLFTELVEEYEQIKQREERLKIMLPDDLFSDCEKWKRRTIKGRVEWLIENCKQKTSSTQS